MSKNKKIKNAVHTNIAFESSFIEKVKRYAEERQMGYQTLLRMLAIERWIQIEEKHQNMHYGRNKLSK